MKCVSIIIISLLLVSTALISTASANNSEKWFLMSRHGEYVEIIKIRTDKPIMTLRTVCVNAKGVVAIEGEAVVKVS